MVKLRVTARVIPEDVYLASLESPAAQSTQLRGEKRFFVIVREPESWFIGTLAVEIKKRYESLYKHDLGQIKYLKDSADDCDLDPELYVADALVDEGKALADPSDQHVSVKVIQEQGRTVRYGSVVPDLFQDHYRLPERPSRPPVPRFEDIASSLGKRKPGNDTDRSNTARKRTRMDEIEEDDLVASIEQDQPVRSDVVIENSQPFESSPSTAKQQHTRAPTSPEVAWSFSQIGHPTTTQRSQQPETNETTWTSRDEDSQHFSRPQSVRRTPSGGLNRLNSPRINGGSGISPLASASSASKKFLKPPRETFAEPESDIDDSQMSPGSRDTSRITPRLVPSGITSDKHGLIDKTGSKSPRRKIFDNSADSSATDQTSVNQSRQATVVNIHNGTSSTTDERMSENDSEPDQDAAKGASASRGFNPDKIVQGTGNSIAAENATENIPHEQNKDRDLSETSEAQSEASQPTSRPVSAGLKQSSTASTYSEASRKRAAANLDLSEAPEPGDVISSDAGSQPSKTGSQPESGEVRRRMERTKGPSSFKPDQITAGELSTPPPDSPSEQLSQALQESARKPAPKKPVHLIDNEATTIGSIIGKDQSSSITSSIRHEQHADNMSKASTEMSEGKTRRKRSRRSKGLVEQAKPVPSVILEAGTRLQERTPKLTDLDVVETAKSDVVNDTLALPTTSQTTRERSTDSHITNSSKTALPILPPGMTQAEYDRLVKSYGNRKEWSLDEKRKRKSTPSRRKTPSIETSSSKAGQPVVEPKDDVKVASPDAAGKDLTQEVANTLGAATADAKSAEDSSAAAAKKIKAKAVQESAAAIKGRLKPSFKDNVKPRGAKAKSASMAPALSEDTKPDKPQSDDEASSSAVSTPSTSKKNAHRANSSQPAPATQKQPTPVSSTVSRLTPTTSNKQAAKASALSALKPMPPPSSSSVAKSSITETTPTPKPRTQPPISKTPTPESTAPKTINSISKSAPKPAARPVIPKQLSDARSLKQLRAMTSANNSASGSPAPGMSRFAQVKKKGILNSNSESESDASSSSSGDTSDNPTKTTASRAQPTAKTTTTPASAKKTAAAAQPDPTIRDASDDSSDDDDE